MHEFTDITALLRAHREGDGAALARLHEALYQRLRRIASGQLRRLPSPNHTLDTNALVHEAYLRLVDQSQADYRDREHFLAAAARAMRHILIDLARRRVAQKRGGERVRVDFDSVEISLGEQAPVLLEIHQVLEDLEKHSPRLVRVVECRFFAGMSEVEAAAVLGISRKTAQRDWVKAKGWLRRQLESRDPSPSPSSSPSPSTD